MAAPSLLLQAARLTASRTAGAGGASSRAAPSQSLELPAVRSARCVCGAHSRSRTDTNSAYDITTSTPAVTRCHISSHPDSYVQVLVPKTE
jgi:hypothetical protein